jgi:hypothetical protein
MNDKVERMWKEVVMACFKDLPLHSSEKTEDNQENPT